MTARPPVTGDSFDLVRAETLALLFRQSAPGSLYSLLVGAFLVAAIWSGASQERLLAWLSAVALLAFLRLGLFIAYFRVQPTGPAIERWRAPYVVSLMLASAIWGLGTLWILPTATPTHQAVVFGFLIGMAGSALNVYSAVRPIALGAFGLTLGPCVLWFIARGEMPWLGLGLGGLAFCVSAPRATRILSDALAERIRVGQALDRARLDAEVAARTDALTGLNNRRAFHEAANQRLEMARRDGLAVTALLIDIDHFKRINDEHGHACGDEALAQVGRLLATGLGPEALVGRLGGEEFGVLLPGREDAALALADRLRRALATLRLAGAGAHAPITASIGIASGGHTLEDLLRRADQAMYRAKQAGRDRAGH